MLQKKSDGKSDEKVATSNDPEDSDTTGSTSDPYEVGLSIYEGNCLSCHGNMGKTDIMDQIYSLVS